MTKLAVLLKYDFEILDLEYFHFMPHYASNNLLKKGNNVLSLHFLTVVVTSYFAYSNELKENILYHKM